MVLVMEFAAGGELYDYLSERKVLAEEEARRIFRQVSTAIYYCHKHKICHRDLKLENILLDEHGNAKVSFISNTAFFERGRRILHARDETLSIIFKFNLQTKSFQLKIFPREFNFEFRLSQQRPRINVKFISVILDCRFWFVECI